ncbi:MAG TPA: hypothetical protein VKR32_16555 [Puia sp.]|nr:hypothetical protein [Puia sp.]
MSAEKDRLLIKDWKKWGPYVSDRQWGTVREDYSADGEPWLYTTHDMARSKAWRWGEEGIAGICDDQQHLCFAVAMWNGKDPIIKERYFGLTSYEGNHGEDVKELYYYLDSTPTHSYMKMLYKYPQQEFPYATLLEENKKRTRQDPEFELIDTGIFSNDQYFDVFVEYAKAAADDILVKVSIVNRGKDAASVMILPTVWFRNTWSWGYDADKPEMFAINENTVEMQHKQLGKWRVYCEHAGDLLFCENETNSNRLYEIDKGLKYYKDGINDHIVHGADSVNPDRGGTKASACYDLSVSPGQSQSIRLRLSAHDLDNAFGDFEQLFSARIAEADAYYREVQQDLKSDDEKLVQRQAFAGMLWCKQFYYYDVQQWLEGDPAEPKPPLSRLNGRNKGWRNLNNADIISMPDKWEYPWYASWDLAFHCISLAMIDPAFAKKQLTLLSHEWYMHPSGQFPAYEWCFDDSNPPVHAWTACRVYEIDKQNNGGKGDTVFLETLFHKLIINFTWWVNKKDAEGNNIFEGGFLGMDNISLFDRNTRLPGGAYLEQSDGTSWMAMYALNLMRMALELAQTNPVYQDMATKFFEHFLYIAAAMASMGENNSGLWDNDDEFFYDILRLENNEVIKLKIRSMVGLIPLFAVEILDHTLQETQPAFIARMRWFLNCRPDLASLVSRYDEMGMNEKHLLSLLRGHRLKRILKRMLDETEFLSDYGVRALSKYHEQHPYEFKIDGQTLSVEYTPAESTIPLFGGNSNWRGPVWMPVNFMIIESLFRFHDYYGDDFKVEYPTNSGNYFSLREIAQELSKRLSRLFLRNEQGKRPVFGNNDKIQADPNFNDYILFYEYFHGDNGRGVGASHQTGWTGLIAKLLGSLAKPDIDNGKDN